MDLDAIGKLLNGAEKVFSFGKPFFECASRAAEWFKRRQEKELPKKNRGETHRRHRRRERESTPDSPDRRGSRRRDRGREDGRKHTSRSQEADRHGARRKHGHRGHSERAYSDARRGPESGECNGKWWQPETRPWSPPRRDTRREEPVAWARTRSQDATLQRPKHVDVPHEGWRYVSRTRSPLSRGPSRIRSSVSQGPRRQVVELHERNAGTRAVAPPRAPTPPPPPRLPSWYTERRGSRA